MADEFIVGRYVRFIVRDGDQNNYPEYGPFGRIIDAPYNSGRIGVELMAHYPDSQHPEITGQYANFDKAKCKIICKPSQCRFV